MLQTSSLDAVVSASRVNVVGTSGSGKSTFARRLACLKAVPYIEMDQLFWKPQWQESTDEEYFPKLQEVTQRPAWVLDGNYTRTTHIKWPRTEVVVLIDLPFVQTVYRVMRRAIDRSVTKRELWPGTGNVETFVRSFFSKKSIIWWAMTHHQPNREKYLSPTVFADYPHIQFLHLRSSAEVRDCLSYVERCTGHV